MLSQDFIDILSAFTDEKVEYMVVGGYAMAFHGFVRATGDIDLWIRASEENAERVWRGLQKFGAPLFDLSREDLLAPEMVFQMGVVPNRIDLITSVDGVTFDEAWKDHQIVEIEDLRVPIVAKSHLLVNKRLPADQKIDSMSCGWKMEIRGNKCVNVLCSWLF